MAQLGRDTEATRFDTGRVAPSGERSPLPCLTPVVPVHTHSGPETWYLLTGEQCLELPDRAVRAHAGETMFAPADTRMKLNMLGPGKRDALFIIVHDSSKPTTTFLDWKPKGLCQK
jgi:mannose-6-phosphate isomerase-like protein (cupin superfamily)